MNESSPDLNLSRRRLLGLGVAAIPTVMLLGAGTAAASPGPAAHPVAAAAPSSPAINAQPQTPFVYFC
jgi:hypothetical protein